jgi:2-dehydro-3-deoxygluconokinase
MIELRHLGENRLELAFGGDTLNTAIYLARLAGKACVVRYATALGDDPYSAEMRAFFATEGIDTTLVATIPGRLPGLYAIRTDTQGERSFYYWRREAAARAMLDGADGEALAAALIEHDWLYVSGITLSILEPAARDRLFAALAAARRRGARVAFDTNFRPRGWPDRELARAAMTAAMRHADIVLPTFPDEQALFGDADPRATVARLRAIGVGEIAIKNGPEPATIATADGIREVPCAPVARVVDTSAAGDAFNAAYLLSRMRGLAPDAAARDGHRLAGIVVGHRGAVIAREAMGS